MRTLSESFAALSASTAQAAEAVSAFRDAAVTAWRIVRRRRLRAMPYTEFRKRRLDALPL